MARNCSDQGLVLKRTCGSPFWGHSAASDPVVLRGDMWRCIRNGVYFPAGDPLNASVLWTPAYVGTGLILTHARKFRPSTERKYWYPIEKQEKANDTAKHWAALQILDSKSRQGPLLF